MKKACDKMKNIMLTLNKRVSRRYFFTSFTYYGKYGFKKGI